MEGFLSLHTGDTVVHIPGRGSMAGDHRGKDAVAKMLQQQMQMLDSPPETENHDILASDDDAVVPEQGAGASRWQDPRTRLGARDAPRGWQDRRDLAAVFRSASHGQVRLVLKPLTW